MGTLSHYPFQLIDCQNNPVLARSIELALLAIEFCDHLDEQKKYVISKQLLRSATSVGANIVEAQSAESRADFIHKLKIADKESNETWFWLLLCEKAESLPYDQRLSDKLTEVKKLLNTIIGSANRNKGH